MRWRNNTIRKIKVIGQPSDVQGPGKGITVDYKNFYRDFCREMG
ncbi:MAG: hypothetical protein ACFFFB_14345 [Candidatus Heimdallarchaeota archaeon]